MAVASIKMSLAAALAEVAGEKNNATERHTRTLRSSELSKLASELIEKLPKKCLAQHPPMCISPHVPYMRVIPARFSKACKERIS